MNVEIGSQLHNAANSTGYVCWIYNKHVCEKITLKSLIVWFAFNLLKSHDPPVTRISASSANFEKYMTLTLVKC